MMNKMKTAMLLMVSIVSIAHAEEAEPFTIAVLPDTQYYCDVRHKLSAKWQAGDLRRYFFAQTQWIHDSRERLNTAFAVHVGDIVQTDVPEDWEIAREAMFTIEGKVPYALCLGNHDMGYRKTDTNRFGCEIAMDRSTRFNEYFPRKVAAQKSEFGGSFHPQRHDNSWYHFEAAGMKFMVLSLEFIPRDEVITWANNVVSKHPDHRVIVLTHVYLKPDKTRTTHDNSPLKGNYGEQIWQKLVSKHQNIFMVLCGHITGEAVLISKGDQGNTVYQILVDYQEWNKGGESWLRYMTFRPRQNIISSYTYNPVLDEHRETPASRFDLVYPMTEEVSD